MKKNIKISKADVWAWISFVCMLIATTLFLVSFVFTVYALEGFLAVPPAVLVIANAFSVVAIVLALYAIKMGANRKIALTSLFVSLLVVSFPYLSTAIQF